MLFNSYSFLIFFPIVVFVTFIIPKRFQYIWLLVASYYFYMCWNAKYVLLLLLSTFITYVSGLLIERYQEDATVKKIVVGISFTINIGILFFFKYFNFVYESLSALCERIGVTLPDNKLTLLLPVGISFYIFQALSYTVDVYRHDVKAEKNFLKYALFVSFFPQLVAGPIERSKNLLRQINKQHSFDYDNMREGLLIMLWGYFLKLVIADRAALLVDTVYGNATDFSGSNLLLASVIFAIQIYTDFAGYSTIAVGAAKVLGFDLMENFNCPYFSTNLGEFWSRWHISLSSWFRDYLYIPLGGNRKGKIRKYLNLLIVMLVSGLWHGAEWSFVMWGGIHGIYQICSDICKPLRKKIECFRHTFVIGKVTTCIQMIITFCFVVFAWIFFRADNIEMANSIVSKIFADRHILFNSGLDFSELGLSQPNFIVLIVAIVILFFADCCKMKKIKVRECIMKQNLFCRWLIYLCSLLFILVFGIWGSAYDAANFIYFQF